MNNKDVCKYLIALLLFGSNGIVASRIALDSSAIVFTRARIGALFLGVIFISSRQPLRFRQNKLHSFYLIASGVAICGYLEPLSALIFSAALLGESLGVLQLAGAALILGGAACGELLRPNREWSCRGWVRPTAPGR